MHSWAHRGTSSRSAEGNVLVDADGAGVLAVVKVIREGPHRGSGPVTKSLVGLSHVSCGAFGAATLAFEVAVHVCGLLAIDVFCGMNHGVHRCLLGFGPVWAALLTPTTFLAKAGATALGIRPIFGGSVRAYGA